jgi:hypothetical protein
MSFEWGKPIGGRDAPSCVLSRQGVKMARSRKRETNMTIQAKLEWKEKMQFVGQAGEGFGRGQTDEGFARP